jgi:hypothetical protein
VDDIVLHELTKAHVERFVAQPSHALLIAGHAGIGKQYLAEHMMASLLGKNATDYPYLRTITPEKDKSSIGIEAVRDLQQFLKLKLPTNAAWRLIAIPDAQGLTTEAQNALLKLLEEPPERTIFILASSSEQALLPTIRSRVQQLTVHIPAQADVVQYFQTQGYDSKDIQQAYLMSGGLPGLMQSLLGDLEHPLKSAVETARKLLQSTQFERLALVDSLSKDKPATLNVLFVLQHMARAAALQGSKATDGSATKRIKQWHKVQQAAYEAEQAYGVSAQAKLTLTNLMLSL